MRSNGTYAIILHLLCVAGCLFVSCLFFIEPLKFPVNVDDVLYQELLKKHAILELMELLPKREGIYLSHFDGRYIGNLLGLLVFSIVKSNISLYMLFEFATFVLSAFIIHIFLKELIKADVIKFDRASNRILVSYFTATCLFCMLFDGRYEVFYWISSICNHLSSVLLFLVMLKLLISPAGILQSMVICLLGFCAGLMNEAYAASYLMIILCWSILYRRVIATCLAVAGCIALALWLNYSTAGTAARLHEAVPEFSLVNALKDTFNTLAMPFVNMKYWPLKLGMLGLFYLVIRLHFQATRLFAFGQIFILNRALLAIGIFGVFLQAFLLRMDCPYRGRILYNLILLYFVFVMASRKTLNPLKVFFI